MNVQRIRCQMHAMSHFRIFGIKSPQLVSYFFIENGCWKNKQVSKQVESKANLYVGLSMPG